MKIAVDFSEKPQYSPEYLKLHKKFDVPLHGMTAEQIRFMHYAFRNEVNVFMRKCDLSGETIISQFPPDSPFTVYRHDLWWKGDFEVAEAEYNPKESFFEQFRRLQLKVPRMGTACDTTKENSPYTNCTNHCKDCHMSFGSGECQDCFYCINAERSVTTMDSSIIYECNKCYGLTSCRSCYNLDFSAFCNECSDSQFLYDCRRCKNCFLCVGLVGKEYCILNKQYSKEEYERELKKYLPLTPETIQRCYEQLAELRKSYPHKYANIIGSENCTGNDISFSQNCTDSYIMEKCQDCINCSVLRNSKDCLDFNLWGDPAELCYNSGSCGYHVYFVRMSFDCWNNCRFLTYCDSCPGCEECFGCVGLQRRKYCILNKQYTKDEYFALKEKIITDMTARGEWGKFFPAFCSPYALNNSMAAEYFEVNEKLARTLGFDWADTSKQQEYDKGSVYSGSMMSSEVSAADIKGKVFLCQKTGQPYNIQARELAILQEKNLPLPQKHWRVRMEERAANFMFPWKLRQRKTVDTGRMVLSPVPEQYAVREEATA